MSAARPQEEGEKDNGIFAGRIWLVAIAALYGALYLQSLSLPPASGFALNPVAPQRHDLDPAPFYGEHYASSAATPSVHSPTAIAIPGGLRAFWYGGAREGAGDVAIYSAVYDLRMGAWSGERRVVTREMTQQGVRRHIRKLGNPVALRGADGRLWLFYVSVSVGGWSGSAINVITSGDDGATWGAPRRLVASPFLNISTLVKGRPFLYEDGTIGLPAYHEFAGKFGELLRLDAAGSVIAKHRLSHGRYSLQPVVVPRSRTEAVAFMRYSGEPPSAVLMQRTPDAGRSWSRPVKLALPNPNAAIDAFATENGALALVFNNHHGDREDLSLALSKDEGRNWRVLHAFEDSADAEFSYPWIAQARDGDARFHLFYTWKRSHIKHIKFDGDWLKQRE